MNANNYFPVGAPEHGLAPDETAESTGIQSPGIASQTHSNLQLGTAADDNEQPLINPGSLHVSGKLLLRGIPCFSEIFLLNIPCWQDGYACPQDLQPLPKNDPDALVCDPAFSPSGEYLLFSSTWMSEEAEGAIMLMNLRDQSITRVTDTPDRFHYSPDWSPDGTQIVYSVENSVGISDIMINQLSGCCEKKLPNIYRNNTNPAWSPDGRFIAFVGGDKFGYGSLHLYAVKSQNVIEVGPGLKIPRSQAPLWSPDSTKIAFTALQGNGSDVCVFYLEDRSTDCVADTTLAEAHPAWSAEGALLAYSGYDQRTEQSAIYINDLSTGEVRQISGDHGYYYRPFWIPGTEYFICTKKVDDVFEVVLIDSQATLEIQLTTTEYGLYFEDYFAGD